MKFYLRAFLMILAVVVMAGISFAPVWRWEPGIVSKKVILANVR